MTTRSRGNGAIAQMTPPVTGAPTPTVKPPKKRAAEFAKIAETTTTTTEPEEPPKKRAKAKSATVTTSTKTDTPIPPTEIKQGNKYSIV